MPSYQGIMRRLTRRVSNVASVRGYAQQPFHLGKALKLVQDLPSPTDAINRVSIALGLSEPPSMDKLNAVIKEINNKWDYDARVKFNTVFIENVQVVTKEFILEYCQYIDHLGRYFSYNGRMTTDVDFIKQLVANGANFKYFMKTVNELNQYFSSDGKIDPNLLMFQFEYLHADNKYIFGVTKDIPETIRSEYFNDDSFIKQYLGYFSNADWRYIVDVRKADRKFIERYWNKINFPYYFEQCENFTYDAVKQVLTDGYIDQLTPEIWEAVLQRVEKDGQLELLYELCGSKIRFPWMLFNGAIEISIAYIPKIESIRDGTLLAIFNKWSNNIPLSHMYQEDSNGLNDLLKPLNMAYNSYPVCPNDHIANMVATVMAMHAAQVSEKAMIGFNASIQTQCSRTLKRVLPIYLKIDKQKATDSCIASSKN